MLEVDSMKKTITKIIITVASLILFMMILPWLAIEFGDGWAVTGLWMFAFFTANPALVIGLSIWSKSQGVGPSKIENIL